jgi:integration host factor subunit alpha
MSLTMDKIVDKLVQDHGLQRREAADLLDTFVEHIRTEVEAGRRVVLPSFGAFFLKKQRHQRKRRDIPVDEDTPAWSIPSFRPAKKLKDRVQYATVAESRDVD